MPNTPIRVLAVDDRPDNLLAIEVALRSADYELVTVGSGPDALRWLLDHDCALILMDVQMPEMDGFETARLIKQRPRSRETPIIFLTAINKEGIYVGQGYAVGAVDYLVKPFDADVLRAKVGVFASLYRSRQEILRQAEIIREHEKSERLRELAELELKSIRREQVLQQRYRELVNGIAHAIIWSAAPDSLALTFVSPSAAEILGHPLDRWSESGFWQSQLHPDDREWVPKRLLQVRNDGRPAVFEHRIFRADGTLAWLQTSARVTPTPDGTVSLNLLSVDLTRQKQAEGALRTVAQASAELSVSLDPDDTLDRLFRLLVPKLADWCVVELSEPHEDRTRVRVRCHAAPPWEDASLAYCQQRGKEAPAPGLVSGSVFVPRVTDENLRAHCRTSEQLEALRALRPHSWIVTALHVGDQTIGALTLGLSNPERRYDEATVLLAEEVGRRAAQAIENARLHRQVQDSVRLREDFLSIASHELRTPLTPLKLQLGSLEKLLLEDHVPPELREASAKKLHATQRHIDRLAKLVESLLDVSRIRTGRLELQFEEVDLGALVQEVTARFRDELSREGIELKLQLDPGLHGSWDRSRVDQILTNLLTNAIKYGKQKPIEVTGRLVEEHVALTVRDHGIGIAGKNPERVFHRFERAVDARSYAGLGLGLYIVSQLVEAHGGTVYVSTQPGVGSAFTVELPRSRLGPRSSATTAAVTSAPEPARNGPPLDGQRAPLE